MKINVFVMAFAMILSSCSLTQAQTPYSVMPAGLYQVDDTHVSLTWKVSHMGLSNYTARFTDIKADLNFDPKHLENSTLSAVIDPASVKTDYPHAEKKDFDKKLADESDWFNALKFPEITYVSTSIEKISETTGIMHGNLTFLGVTKALPLNVTFNGAMAQHPFNQKPMLGFSASGVMKRSEWGMGTYIPTIGDDVSLAIEVEFMKVE
jgi:polyisoprenoid-binding protein YceI